MKVFIVNINMLLWPKAIAERVIVENHEPVIVDNCSTYQPLLDWYATKPCEIVRLSNNYSFMAPWSQKLIDHMVAPGEFYAETDGDIDISKAPSGFIEFLKNGIEKYGHWASKATLGMEVNDLPEYVPDWILADINRYYNNLWTRQLDEDFFIADSDCPFAVYKKLPNGVWYDRARVANEPEYHKWFHQSFVPWYAAIRTRKPYIMRHMPWYLNPKDLPDEFKYYLKSYIPTPNSWAARLAKTAGI